MGEGRARTALMSVQTKYQSLPPCTVNRSLNFQCEVIKGIKLSCEMDIIAPIVTFLSLWYFLNQRVGQSALPRISY